MKFTSVFHNENGENTYLVFDENTKRGIVIDPGAPIEKIKGMIEENGVEVEYIFLTHCHYDHIMCLKKLKEITGARILSGEVCAKNLPEPNVNLSFYGLGYNIDDVFCDITLKDKEIFELDSLRIKCIYTPGHTSCSVCYLAENDLFCGDTLFLRSCGRWDLPTGDFKTLEKSIKERLYTLPEDIVVHSGHGHDTNIGYEKKYNLCVKL